MEDSVLVTEVGGVLRSTDSGVGVDDDVESLTQSGVAPEVHLGADGDDVVFSSSRGPDSV